MPRHVHLSKEVYSTAGLGRILAAYIGTIPNRQKLHKWLHTGKEHGYFPNTRQERPYIANSPWVIPRVDIQTYLNETYPQGVLPHLADDALIF